MKTVTVRDLQKRIKENIDTAQKEQVVVTRRGKPAVVLTGAEGQDWEDVILQTSASFWKLIESRRKGKTLSLQEVKKRLKIK